MKNSSPVKKLMTRNISLAQIIGFAVTNMVGLSIVMIALQFYRDVDHVINGENELVSGEYIVVSKSVNPFGNTVTTFTREEIDSISSQPWAEDVGIFTPSQFNISASVDLNGAGLSTALFFESVPDRFLDVVPHGWNFNENDNTIPVIISKEYLSLYNFGFASSRGLPTVSEAMLGMIPLRISVSGNGREQSFKGRIAGFSSRLNTIAVPESFMTWANQQFGTLTETNPSRLIIKNNQPGNPEIEEYLAAHNIETGRENSSSKLNFFLSLLTSVVAGVGIIICTLSLFILLLSLHLILQKNSTRIRNLLLLGYTPSMLSRYYSNMIIGVNLTVLAIASVIMTITAGLWITPLAALDVTPTPIWPTLIAGTIITATVTTVNLISVNRAVKRCF